jgi:hypothetical protein
MAIASVTGPAERTAEREFYVAIENAGQSDVVVNLGSRIGR